MKSEYSFSEYFVLQSIQHLPLRESWCQIKPRYVQTVAEYGPVATNCSECDEKE